MAVSRRLRFEILRRDNHTCRYCGASAPDVKLTVDHVVPTTLGGSDDPSNLVTACATCNSGKSSVAPDTPLVDDVAMDALRWSAAMKKAAEEMELQEGPKAEYRDTFESIWNEWAYEHNGKRVTFDLPADWKTSVERFRQAGLPLSAWPDIVETAMTNRAVQVQNIFRYCCGIAWRLVGQLQERAQELASEKAKASAKNTYSPQFMHVFLVWTWAWERTGSFAHTQAIDEFAATTVQALDDGFAGECDLTEAAFWAGQNHSCDIRDFLATSCNNDSEEAST